MAFRMLSAKIDFFNPVIFLLFGVRKLKCMKNELGKIRIFLPKENRED